MTPPPQEGEGIVSVAADHDDDDDDDEESSRDERDVLSSMRGVDCLSNAVQVQLMESSSSNNNTGNNAISNNNGETSSSSSSSPGVMVRVAISFTGGKDCHLALHRSMSTPGIKVVCLAIFSTPGREFSAHRIEWQQQQAAALKLPLEMCHLHLQQQDDEKQHDFVDDYARAYAAAIRKLQEDYDIQYIVTGDVDLVGKSTTNFMQQDVCRSSGGSGGGGRCDSGSVQVLLPLWQQSRLALLEEMLDNDFDIRFSCVKTPYFDASWIGRRLDRVAIQDMKSRNDLVQNKSTAAKESCSGEETRIRPLDFTGENGEYHTMVVDGPMYRRRRRRSNDHDHHHHHQGQHSASSSRHHQTPSPPPRLRIINVASKEITGRAGQAQGERWWVFDEATTKLVLE